MGAQGGEHFRSGLQGLTSIVTGGGDGIGRALVHALAAEGCSVFVGDIEASKVALTISECRSMGLAGTVDGRVVDVSDVESVEVFRAEVASCFDHLNLLFNIAGIGGGGSFVAGDQEEWERTFAVSWGGVYNCCRAFMPLLLKAEEGHVINMSSVKAFWATRGPSRPHTAYSSAKAAVKAFTEGLIHDFELYVPHLRASVVMPGHVGTSITANSRRILRGGVEPDPVVIEQARAFRESAPISAADAAKRILEGVRQNEWRILVGEDARELDRVVRLNPDVIYDDDFRGIIIYQVDDFSNWGK